MKSYSVYDGDRLIAIVAKRGIAPSPGVTFFTPPDSSQQVGYQFRAKGEHVPPHEHLPVTQSPNNLAEVLIVQRGRMRVRLYAAEGELLHEVDIVDGEMILLESGVHEVIFEEETEMFEVKQGPYIGRAEKRIMDW